MCRRWCCGCRVPCCDTGGSMTMRITRRGLLAAGLAAPFVARTALAQAVTLRAAHTNAVGEVQDKGLKVMDRRLRELTSGRAGLQIFPNGQLGNELPMVEGV